MWLYYTQAEKVNTRVYGIHILKITPAFENASQPKKTRSSVDGDLLTFRTLL
jgi:hypothetical protein